MKVGLYVYASYQRDRLIISLDVPSVQVSDTSDEINKILGKQGIKYSHQNDHLLRPSRVEEMSLQEAVKVNIISPHIPFASASKLFMITPFKENQETKGQYNWSKK